MSNAEDCRNGRCPWINPNKQQLAMRKEETSQLVGAITYATNWHPQMVLMWIVKFAYACAMKDHVIVNAMMETYKAHLWSEYDPLAKAKNAEGWFANANNN